YISELASALSPSAERSLETHAMGEAFVIAVSAGWPSRQLETWISHLDTPITYPVAIGLATSPYELDQTVVLSAYATSVISNLLSAAIRLSVIGQSDAQVIQAGLESLVDSQAEKLTDATLDQLGSACLMSDLCSIQHETMNTRLFRT
ncbi:MAG: urease accessory protein UreF, partial [Desulfobulbia bacterium]